MFTVRKGVTVYSLRFVDNKGWNMEDCEIQRYSLPRKVAGNRNRES
jgi:hypothetical protein